MELDQISKHVIYLMDFDRDNKTNGNIQVKWDKYSLNDLSQQQNSQYQQMFWISNPFPMEHIVI